MKRQDYIKLQSIELKKSMDKANRLSEKWLSCNDFKESKKLSNELNYLNMSIEKTKERIGFALGYISADEVQSEWRVDAMHVYPGIKEELLNLKFD